MIPAPTAWSMECDYNVAYLRRVMERYGLGGRWAYWDAINDVYHGLSRERVRRALSRGRCAHQSVRRDAAA